MKRVILFGLLCLAVFNGPMDSVMNSAHADPQHTNIIVVPGGGATGIISIRILEELERRTGMKVSELFQRAWGASIGAMILTDLTVPVEGPNGKQTVKSAAEVAQFIRKSFRNPFKALKSISKFQRRIGKRARMRDTVIPVNFLFAKIRDYSPDASWLGQSELRTEHVGFGSETHGGASVAKVAAVSATVYPIFRPVRVRCPCTKEVMHGIDAGSDACSWPTMNPTDHFLAEYQRMMQPGDTATLYFISNGWTRDGRGMDGKPYPIAPGIEFVNFDVDLNSIMNMFGQRGQWYVANLMGAGLFPNSLDRAAKTAIRQHEDLLDRVASDLRSHALRVSRNRRIIP